MSCRTARILFILNFGSIWLQHLCNSTHNERKFFYHNQVLCIHALKFFRKVIHGIQRAQEMLERKLLSTTHSQRLCCPRRILNLPAIYIPLRQFLDLLRSDIRRRSNLADESRPDLYLGLKGQLVEM